MNSLQLPDSGPKYDLGFARWVYKNISGGDKLSMCMQCGACSGSCPIGTDMDHGPRKLIMMIRAGMKEEVLQSDTLWNCTHCYRCTVRCPRGIPVTHIIQGLGAAAADLGYANETETVRFARSFWWSVVHFGRTDERLVTAKYYFSFGLVEGMKRGMANLKIAIRLVLKGRMHLGLPHKVSGKKDLQAILKKAAEIEAREANHG